MELKYWITLFGLSCVSGSADPWEWTTLRSKYSFLDILHVDSFFEMPLTLEEAVSKDWVKPGETSGQKHLRTLCRKSKAYVCLLYNDRGAVAGYQVSIPRVVDSLSMPGMDYTRKGYKPTTLFGKQWYSITVYFESQTSILQGGRPLDGHTRSSLWIPLNGEIVEIPRTQRGLQDYFPEFKKQNCFNKMGTHFFYNMDRSLQPRDFQTIFLLYKNQQLIGFGINAFGANAKPKSIRDYIPFAKRNWFEDVPKSAVRKVAPDTPDWALDYHKNYGVFSHHVYFVDKPWKIDCDEE